MKKVITTKLTIAIAAVLVAVLMSLLFIPRIIGNTNADTELEKDRYTTLSPGKYMHTSGDKDKYVEVFEDQTLQIFGYDTFEETINNPENKEFFAGMTIEEFNEIDNFRLWEHSIWFNQRHLYIVDNYLDMARFFQTNTDMDEDLSPFGIPGRRGQQSGSGLFVKDGGRTLFINDDNVYVYSG